MNKKNELPNKISVFPISNFIIFPKTTVPLNIFEPRYIKMVDDSMKSSRMIGMVQPKKKSNKSIPELYEVGCVGKITSFNESEDGRYLIVLNGLSRFKILDEIKNNKLYRECKVSFNEFKNDINSNKEEIKFCVSSNACFSSKENGEAIASVLIVWFKSCFSNSFQLIM